jgi:sugar lactone lactonase YvrE
MKLKGVILYVVVFTAAAIACKKGDSGGLQVPPPPAPEKKATVSTFAGDGTGGYLDGLLLSARFYTPSDVAISGDGTLYVADYNSRRIRKITGGQVSLLAGDGHFGTRNGDGDTAQFVDPFRIEVDADDNVYVMDQADARVRRGKETKGFVDGDTSVAEFLNPAVNTNFLLWKPLFSSLWVWHYCTLLLT